MTYVKELDNLKWGIRPLAYEEIYNVDAVSKTRIRRFQSDEIGAGGENFWENVLLKIF